MFNALDDIHVGPSRDDDIDGLFCFKCHHNLDKSLYNICRHPECYFIPLCAVCLEEVNEFNLDLNNNAQDTNDVCLICKDGGELLQCDDCSDWYCKECVELIEETTLEENDDEWFCLQCQNDGERNDTSVASLTVPINNPMKRRLNAVIVKGQQRSIYNMDNDVYKDLKEKINLHMRERQTRTETEPAELKHSNTVSLDKDMNDILTANIIYYRMLMLQEGIRVCNGILCDAQLKATRDEIQRELLEAHQTKSMDMIGRDCDVEEAVDMEMTEYVSQWERDLLICSYQEMECKTLLKDQYQCLSVNEYYDNQGNDGLSDQETHGNQIEVLGKTEIDTGAQTEEPSYRRRYGRKYEMHEGNSSVDKTADSDPNMPLMPIANDHLLQRLTVAIDNLILCCEKNESHCYDKVLASSSEPSAGDKIIFELLKKYNHHKTLRLSTDSCPNSENSASFYVCTCFLPGDILHSLPLTLLYCLSNPELTYGDLRSLSEYFSLPEYAVVLFKYLPNYIDVAASKHWESCKYYEPESDNSADSQISGRSLLDWYLDGIHPSLVNVLYCSEDYSEKLLIQEHYSEIIPRSYIDCEVLDDDGNDSEDAELSSIGDGSNTLMSDKHGVLTASRALMTEYSNRVEDNWVGSNVVSKKSNSGRGSTKANRLHRELMQFLESEAEQKATGVSAKSKGRKSGNSTGLRVLSEKQDSICNKILSTQASKPRSVSTSSSGFGARRITMKTKGNDVSNVNAERHPVVEKVTLGQGLGTAAENIENASAEVKSESKLVSSLKTQQEPVLAALPTMSTSDSRRKLFDYFNNSNSVPSPNPLSTSREGSTPTPNSSSISKSNRNPSPVIDAKDAERDGPFRAIPVTPTAASVNMELEHNTIEINNSGITNKQDGNRSPVIADTAPIATLRKVTSNQSVEAGKNGRDCVPTTCAPSVTRNMTSVNKFKISTVNFVNLVDSSDSVASSDSNSSSDSSDSDTNSKETKSKLCFGSSTESIDNKSKSNSKKRCRPGDSDSGEHSDDMLWQQNWSSSSETSDSDEESGATKIKPLRGKSKFKSNNSSKISKKKEQNDKSTFAPAKRQKSEMRSPSEGDDIVDLLDSDNEIPIQRRPGSMRSLSKYFADNKMSYAIDAIMNKRFLQFHQYQGSFEGGDVINAFRPEEDEAVLMPSCFKSVLKPHQLEAVQFMWKNCINSLSALRSSAEKQLSHHSGGNGCVLAHCMGLGKTLSVIAFLCTLFSSPAITSIITQEEEIEVESSGASDTCDSGGDMVKSEGVAAQQTSVSSSAPRPVASFKERRIIYRVLILTPVNALQNWKMEFKKWARDEFKDCLHIHILDANIGSGIKATVTKGAKQSDKVKKHRLDILQRWYTHGGICIMGYDLLRSLVADSSPSLTTSGPGIEPSSTNVNTSKRYYDNSHSGLCYKFLVNPGADIVIADEAHQIKNPKAKITKAVNEMKTKLKIALTGSPLQNNLLEYWCMVHWVKKSHLGSQKAFIQRFLNPIKEGEDKDATKKQQKKMVQRSFLLHKLLKNIVQRRDITTLAGQLPPKREFVLVLRMTNLQKCLYKQFLVGVMNKALDEEEARVAANMAVLEMGQGSVPLTGTEVEMRAKERGISTQSKNRLVLTCYQSLQRIWNHPLCMLMYSNQQDSSNSNSASVGVHANAGFPQQGTGFSAFRDEMSKLMAYEAHMRVSGGGKQLDYNLNNMQEQLMVDGGEEEQGGEYGNLGGEELVVENMDEGELDGELGADEAALKAGGGRDIGFSLKHDWWKELQLNKDNESGASISDDGLVLLSGKTPSDSSCALDMDMDCISPSISTTSKSCGSANERLLDMDCRIVESGNKLLAFLHILTESVKVGDKVVVFSQSLTTLNLIEMVLKSDSWWKLLGHPSECGLDPGKLKPDEYDKLFSKWTKAREYYRIDGSVSSQLRQKYIDEFNKPDGSGRTCTGGVGSCPVQKYPSRLFLLSTKAGNMGVNLQSANRVIIYDSSWNPAHDLQAMFRCYRYGQKKAVYVYRFLAADTMEEKIYKKQVVKKSLSSRVIDEQTPENHFYAKEREYMLEYKETEHLRGLVQCREDAEDYTQDSATDTGMCGDKDSVPMDAEEGYELELSQSQSQSQLCLNHNPNGHRLKTSVVNILNTYPRDEVLNNLICGFEYNQRPSGHQPPTVKYNSTLSMFGSSILLDVQDESVLLADVEEEHLSELEKQEAEADYHNELNPPAVSIPPPVPVSHAALGAFPVSNGNSMSIAEQQAEIALRVQEHTAQWELIRSQVNVNVNRQEKQRKAHERQGVFSQRQTPANAEAESHIQPNMQNAIFNQHLYPSQLNVPDNFGAGGAVPNNFQQFVMPVPPLPMQGHPPGQTFVAPRYQPLPLSTRSNLVNSPLKRKIPININSKVNAALTPAPTGAVHPTPNSEAQVQEATSLSNAAFVDV